MNNWYSILVSVILFYPQLYPGYLMEGEKQNLGILKIGVNASWILLFICISVLVLVFFLFWRGAWFLKRKKMDH